MYLRSAFIPAGTGLLLATATPAALAAGTTERISVSSSGTQGDSSSGGFQIGLSGNGRYVAFPSLASNLVPDDTTSFSDVFVRDRRTDRTTRVNLGPGGVQANGNVAGSTVAISADGRVVAFGSDATNLVPDDTNGRDDVFVRDRKTGETTRVSVGPGGTEADGNSSPSGLSADGRFVLFFSYATNLVSGDTNGAADVFVHDRKTGTTERVSVGSGGTQASQDSFGGGISGNGRFVTFYTFDVNVVPGGTNFLDSFVHDRKTGRTERVNVGPGGVQGNGDSLLPVISADGRYVAFASAATNLVPGDTNGRFDTFVHDRRTGKNWRVSVASDGTEGNADSGGGYFPAISRDGRHVAFVSSATNLVAGDTNGVDDVFVHDRETGRTGRVSVGLRGGQGDTVSFGPAISADGRAVAFTSDATNLVRKDTNGVSDVFVRAR
jgi:Tol biopolymer transport system component